MRRRRNSGRVISIVVFLIVLLVAVAVGAFVMLSGTLNKIERVSTTPTVVIPPAEEVFEETTSEPDTIKVESVSFNSDGISMMKSDDVKNILLIGQDARPGEERQRSDTLIIASINTHLQKIVLTSLMRDMYVPIPGYSDNRINAAYQFGGMSLMDEVIEEDFGIHIDGNIEVDFEGFIDALTVIGNLEIELSAEEADYINVNSWEDAGIDNSDWTLHEGMNDMTPEQVLAYSRVRYIGNSDWGRTDRQRNVIMTAFRKLQKSDLGTLVRVANQLFPTLTTDLTISEILTFVKTIYTNDIGALESYRLPVDDTYTSETIRGMSVLVPDLYRNSVFLQHYVYGTEMKEAEKKLESKMAGKTVSRDEDTAGDGEEYVPAPEEYSYTPVYTPADTATEQTAAPAQPAAGGTGDAGAVAADPGAANTAPVNTAPAETAPAEPAPVETAPAETAPAEPAPVETAPAETAPVETAPVDTGAGDGGVTDPGAGAEIPPAAPPADAVVSVPEAPADGGAEAAAPAAAE